MRGSCSILYLKSFKLFQRGPFPSQSDFRFSGLTLDLEPCTVGLRAHLALQPHHRSAHGSLLTPHFMYPPLLRVPMLTVIRSEIWGLFSAGLHSLVQPTPKSAFVASLGLSCPCLLLEPGPYPKPRLNTCLPTAHPPVLCLPQSLCLSSKQGFQDI